MPRGEMTALAEQLVTLVALFYPLQFAYQFLRGLSGYSLILQFDSSPYPLIVLILIRLNWSLAVVVNVECGLQTHPTRMYCVCLDGYYYFG